MEKRLSQHIDFKGVALKRTVPSYMIDIHAHILPGMDDGSGSFEESLAMCRAAHRDGTTHIVASPHFVKGKYWPERTTVTEGIGKLQKLLDEEGIELAVLEGSDVYIYPELIRDVRDKTIPTINGTQYVLLELPDTFHPSDVSDFFTRLRNENIIPIISHPERNPEIRDDPQALYELVSNGALVQITALSITGGFGSGIKSFAQTLLKQRLVHIIASDAHSADRRTPVLSKAVEEAAKITGLKQAMDMVTTIPQRIIEGKPVTVPKPAESAAVEKDKTPHPSEKDKTPHPSLQPLTSKMSRAKQSQKHGLRRPLDIKDVKGPGNDGSKGLATMFDALIQIGLLALIALTPWFHGSVYLWTQALAQIAILSIFGLWLIKGFVQKDFSLVKTPLDLPIFTFLGLCIAYTIFSAYRQRSIFELNKILSYIMVYYVAVNTLKTQRRREFFLWAVILTALFYSGYGLLQYYGSLPSSFWHQERSLASRFINSSHFAGYIQLSIFLCIGMMLHKGFFRRVFSALICITLLITLAYTRSRAVWLSLLAGSILMAFLFAKSGLMSANRGFILVFFSIVCVFLIIIFGGEVLATRVKLLFDTQFQSMSQRFDIWRSSLGLVSNRPFGTGLGVFSVVYPQYRLHSDRFFVNYAHNEILQVGAELGVLGLLVLLWAIYRYNKAVLKGIKRCLSTSLSERGILLVSFVGGFTALFIQSMADFPIHIYAVAILFLFLLALNMRILPDSGRKPSEDVGLSRGGLNLLYFCCGLMLLVIPLYSLNLTRVYRADLFNRKGEELEKEFKWDDALEEYKKAASLVSGNADYHARIGSIYARKAALSIDKKDYAIRAIESYRLASRNSPNDAKYHRELAYLYSSNRQKELAHDEFRKAIVLDPTNGRLYLGYGYFCLRNHMVDEGIKYLKRSQFLFSEDPRGEMGRILEECYRYTQDYDKLKKVIIDDAGNHLRLGKFLLDKGMKEEARAEFMRVLELAPGNKTAQQALSNIN